MPFYLYQTGSDQTLLGTRRWERLLAVEHVQADVAIERARVMIPKTPAGTVLELRQKVNKKKRLEVFWFDEGKKSGITDDALIEVATPAHDKESVRRAGTKAAQDASEKKAPKERKPKTGAGTDEAVAPIPGAPKLTVHKGGKSKKKTEAVRSVPVAGSHS